MQLSSTPSMIEIRQVNKWYGDFQVLDDCSTTVGRGEAGLLVKTADGVREPQNRRVEIVVVVASAGYDQVAYCNDLMALYRKTSTASPAQGPVPDAMAQCTAGNPAAGIPVLEKALTDAKVALPPKKMM